MLSRVQKVVRGPKVDSKFCFCHDALADVDRVGDVLTSCEWAPSKRLAPVVIEVKFRWDQARPHLMRSMFSPHFVY